MATDPTAPRSRRSLLAGALGGASVLAADALAKANPVAAVNGEPVLLGQGTTPTDNAATAATVVNATGSNAVGGISSTAIGVYGRSSGTGPRATGVFGATGTGGGVADDTSDTGVYGFSDATVGATGVWGDSEIGTGVRGTGDWGVYGSGFVGIVGDTQGSSNGVYGFAGDEDIHPPIAQAAVLGTAGSGATTGVRGHAAAGSTYGVIASSATTTGQYALYVAGRLRLSRSGRIAISSTATSKAVAMTGVTSSSFVIATLQTLATSGCYIRAVVPTTGSFTIYLSRTPGKTVYVGYVVVN